MSGEAGVSHIALEPSTSRCPVSRFPMKVLPNVSPVKIQGVLHVYTNSYSSYFQITDDKVKLVCVFIYCCIIIIHRGQSLQEAEVEDVEGAVEAEAEGKPE